MQKIIFEDTVVVKNPYITIDGIEHELQDGEYQGGTDLNADTFNTMQNNIETAVNGIIESGSNANGNWIKYDDGTLICHSIKNKNASFSSSQKWGSTWESNLIDLGSFPYTFIEKPTLMVTNISSSGGFLESVEQTSEANIGKVYMCRPMDTNTTVPYTFNIIAIGKWK